MNNILSIIKDALKAIFWMALIFAVIFLVVAGIIQIPAVQNKIVHAATTFISNKTNTKVEILNVGISFPKFVVIDGLYLEDKNKDTLVYAGKARINIALYNLLMNEIEVSSFYLSDLNVNLYSTESDSLFNYEFLLDAFSDTTKTQPQATDNEEESSWTFSIRNVTLENIRLRYNDLYNGMHAAASLEKLNLQMDNIDLVNSVYEIDNLFVDKLAAKVQITKESNTDEKAVDPAVMLPKITAGNIQFTNSTVEFDDRVGSQSVNATISLLEMKEGVVDLHRQSVALDNISLTGSNIRYQAAAETETNAQPADTATTPGNWNVRVKAINFTGNTLAYKVGDKPAIPNAFDPDNIEFRRVNLMANNLYYSPVNTELSVARFNAVDRNNFTIRYFETDFRMDNNSLTLGEINAGFGNSALTGDVNLQYSSLAALKDSLAFMVLNIDIKNASLRNADILYFSPELAAQPFFKNKTSLTTLSGIINGRVNNMRGRNIRVKTGNNTLLTTDFYITGLPDAESSTFHFPNLKLISGKQDIAMFAGPNLPKDIEIPQDINLDVVFNGKMKDFRTSLRLDSSFGDAFLYASLDPKENFTAKLDIAGLNLGSLMKDRAMYGPLTMTAEAKGRGLDAKTIKAKIKANVSQVYLNKYTYNNLNVEGNIAGREFDGKMTLKDKNADIEFTGLVNMNPEQEKYKFALNVLGADLQKLNLTEKDLRVSFVAKADLTGGTINKLNGEAGVTNLIIASKGKRYGLDSLLVASINEPNRSEFNVTSAVMTMKYSGTISPTALPGTLSQFTSRYFLLEDVKPFDPKRDSSDFKFEIQFHNHPIISEVFMPELKEFNPGLIIGSFDSRKMEFKLNADMKRIVYGTTEINDLELDVNSDTTALKYALSSSGISNPQVKFENFLFDGRLSDNKIEANIASTDDKKRRKLLLMSEITKNNGNYRMELDPSEFYLMSNRWDIDNDNYIEFGKNGFRVHNLFISRGESEIKVASVNERFNDDLNISFSSFQLAEVSRIFEKDTSLLKGVMDGNVLLKRVNNAYGLVADATIQDLVVREVPVGNLELKAVNPTTQRFDIDMSLRSADNNVTAGGYFIPSGNANSLNMKAEIQSLSMKTVEAFSLGQLSEAEGNLTGNFTITGKADAPEISGNLAFNNVFVKPAALNNRLELKNETIRIQPDGIYFDKFTMLDQGKHPAVIDGSIKMKQFSDFMFALRVNTKDFLLFNTKAKDNEIFYGRMVIDSRIDVSGPMTLPVVNARIKMKEGSNFTFVVPEDELTTDKGEDVVQFNDSLKLNPILVRGQDEASKETEMKGFDLTSVIEVDKEATLRLLMDPSSSDSLVVRGDAALSFTMDRSGKMSLTGAYNLDDGSYLVSLQSVIKRRFDINQGSTITWNGDPMDADISLNATYSVRTAPYDLVADQMAGMSDSEKGSYKQQYPFLVLLKLRGAILKPEISFEIQLPPEEKGILGGAVNQKLNMLNEDPSSLNKQVFALLVLGRFVQENPLQSEAGGGTAGMVRSTVSSFLSSQLNRLSSKVVPGVDLSFDVQSYEEYETGEGQGRTEVEIGLKKQLFDERLTVELGGSLDVEGERAKRNSASEITSDITVEYKLTEDGRYRLKGFRHNQYEGALEGQIIETGVGAVYVHDFNKWKNLFKATKKKKE